MRFRDISMQLRHHDGIVATGCSKQMRLDVIEHISCLCSGMLGQFPHDYATTRWSAVSRSRKYTSGRV